MKLPQSLGLTALTTGLFLAASTAFAQTITFDEIDSITDDDLLDSDELIAIFGSDDLLRFDMNGDDALSLEELRAATDDDDDDDDDFELDGNGTVDSDGNNGHGNSGGYDPSNPGKSQEDRDDDDDEDFEDDEEEEQEDDDNDDDSRNQGRNNRGGDN